MTSKTGFHEDQARATSHKIAADGVALLARALNRFGAEEVPYRYTEDVQARFFELGIELVRLIEHGEIEPNPAHELYRRALDAKSDKTLQAVLKRASKSRAARGGKRPPVFKGQST